MSESWPDGILSMLATALEMEVDDEQTNEKKRIDEFADCSNDKKKQVQIITLGTESTKNIRADPCSSNIIVSLTVLPFLKQLLDSLPICLFPSHDYDTLLTQ